MEKSFFCLQAATMLRQCMYELGSLDPLRSWSLHSTPNPVTLYLPEFDWRPVGPVAPDGEVNFFVCKLPQCCDSAHTSSGQGSPS